MSNNLKQNQSVVGRLHLEILKGRNLEKETILGKRGICGYCTVKIEGQSKEQTEVITTATTAPIWNKTFNLKILKPFSSVTITVFHHETIGSDECLGQATIDLVDFRDQQQHRDRKSTRLNSSH